MKASKSTSLLLSALAFSLPMVRATTVVYPASHCLSRSGSPFFDGIKAGTIALEDCEDGLFNIPFASSPNVHISGVQRHSVDEDDGVFDGLGIGGSLFLDSLPGPIIFNFTADASGHYPRYVVVVITSPAGRFGDGVGGEVIGMTSAFGASLLSNYQIETPLYVSGTSPLPTYWATFIGAYSEEGISQLTLKNATTFDHLQFGYSIPEPAMSWLVGIPALLLVRHRKSAFPS